MLIYPSVLFVYKVLYCNTLCKSSQHPFGGLSTLLAETLSPGLSLLWWAVIPIVPEGRLRPWPLGGSPGPTAVDGRAHSGVTVCVSPVFSLLCSPSHSSSVLWM